MAATEYIYPSNSELTEIAQEKEPVLTMDDPIFEIMPVENRDAAIIYWEQKDNYKGLQQIRGVNGAPSRVAKNGHKRFMMRPGTYGEFMEIDEFELLNRRQVGTYNQPVNATDLVMEAQDQLQNRRIDRWRYIGWALVTAGVFAVANADGTIMHTDAYPIQQYVSVVGWDTHATATPLADLRAMTLLARGKSTSFGVGSIYYMNQTTLNHMISNTNQNDLAGRRTSGLNTVLNLGEVNSVLAGEGLGRIVVQDDGYYDDTETWQLFIPNGVVAVRGVRKRGEKIARYVMTRNVNNEGMAPGAYQKVIDHGDNKVPRSIEVHDGHDGGPIIEFPGSLVRMDVY